MDGKWQGSAGRKNGQVHRREAGGVTELVVVDYKLVGW